MSEMEEVTKPPVPKECLTKECGLKGLYFREAIYREDLERQLRRVTAQKERYRRATVALLSEIKELLSPDHAALNLLRERLNPINEVCGLYYFVSEGIINLWVIVNEDNFEVETKVAEYLSELFSIFRNLRFDFMIIPRDDLDLSEILPSGSRKVFSK